MSIRHILLSAIACLPLACAASAHPQEELDSAPVQADQAITHGALDRGRHPSVVALYVRSPEGDRLCSGAVIAPDVVLTARHCVAELKGEGLSCPSKIAQVGATIAPETLFVHLGDDVHKGPFSARGRRIVVPPGDVLCDADLALVQLDQPLALEPMALARQGEPKLGGQVVAVGYGQTGASGTAGVRRFRTGVSILRVTGHEFVVDESTCPGDSGGPALDADTGAILGVISRGSLSCDGKGARNVYTRVSGFLGLIDREVGPGATRPSSPEPGDLGDPCSTGGTCASGVCAESTAAQSGGGYCSRKCGPAIGRCPAGYRCGRKPDSPEGVCARRT